MAKKKVIIFCHNNNNSIITDCSIKNFTKEHNIYHYCTAAYSKHDVVEHMGNFLSIDI